MSSPSLRKGKGREIERTTPELLDVTVDSTAKNDVDSYFERMREWEKISTRNTQYRSYPWDKKAGTGQTSTSPIELSLEKDDDNNTNNSQLRSTTLDDSVDSDDGKDFEDLYSDDGKDVKTLQPSRLRKSWELISDEAPSANDTEESSIENSHSKFRQCGTDLMTRHMFSGRMNGKRPIYIPMYDRDKYGYLFRLKRDDKGGWEYKELEKLSESESRAGLKLFEDPKTKKGHSELEDSKRPKT